MEAFAFLQTKHKRAHNEIISALIDVKMAMKPIWSDIGKLLNATDYFRVTDVYQRAVDNIVPSSAAEYDVSLRDIVKVAASSDVPAVPYDEHFKSVWEGVLDYSREGVYNGKPNDLKMMSTFDTLASALTRVAQNIRYFIENVIPELKSMLIGLRKTTV
jgi:hypothetical protein